MTGRLNKRFKKCSLILSCIFLLVSCHEKEHFEPYSFFVAGHTYGSPSNYQGGLYQPFLDQFLMMKQDTLIQKGFLTGDIVKESNRDNWNLVDEQLGQLANIECHFAPGNHDVSNASLYQERYGDTFYSFEYNNDLFVVLDGNLDHWNITGEQLEFLQNELMRVNDEIQNVFLFVHQIIFYDYLQVTPNSPEGKADHLTFEAEVKPLLTNLNCPVYIFAGDVGAFDWGTALFYEKKENVSYIASGMGGGKDDHFLIVDVLADKTVNFRIVPLNNKKWKSIEDY